MESGTSKSVLEKFGGPPGMNARVDITTKTMTFKNTLHNMIWETEHPETSSLQPRDLWNLQAFGQLGCDHPAYCKAFFF
jgi:hypothetical protein